MEAADGIEAGAVHQGDSVYSFLIDTRDIAQYLAKLLGGKSGGNLVPLLTPVEEVLNEQDGIIQFQLRLAPNIVGIAVVEPDKKIKVSMRHKEGFWRRLFGFRKM